jgi:ornithine cyclodeaminase/alanine dehydrogenase-like protein (mu-crystallin family)
MVRISEEDVLRLLPMKEAVRLVREAFAGLADGSAQNQPRRRLFTREGAVLHQLAGAFGKHFGAKIYSTHVKHGAWFTVLVYDSATGKPLAEIEANHLGQIRTGAASGVATDLLARPDAAVLGVIGSGFQAQTQIEAIRVVRPIREVRVWSRDAARREAFAQRMDARATATAEEAIRGADIIVTATYAKDPVLADAWVAAGAHVNAIGSNNPQRREIPTELVNRASVIAVDAIDQARIESGDLLLAWTSPEQWNDPRLIELAGVAAGKTPGRTSAQDVTIFKSNGLGVQDIAVGGYVFERYS